MIATNAMSIAAMPAASFNPSIAPFAAASTIVELVGNIGDVSNGSCSVICCGITIFDNMSPAGADITLAVINADAGTPICIYPAITPPAIVINPPTIIVCNSDLVAEAKYGFIKSGASVCPRNILADALSDSMPVVFNVLLINHDIPLTIYCIIPRWYSTAITEEKKIITGKTDKEIGRAHV